MKHFSAVFITLMCIITYIPGLISSQAYAEEITLTFSEAVAIGLRDNKDILFKIQDLEKAKLKIAEAEGELFPSLAYAGSWFYTAGLYNKDLSQTNSQITIKQYLYKGGSVINNIKYNGYKLEVEQALLDKTKLDAIFQFSKAYYTLLLSNYYIELNREILENSREHLEYIKARYKNGQASETDIIQAQASLSSVEQAYESSRTQKEAAQALLNNLLSLDKDILIIPSTEFQFTPKEVAFDQGFLKAMQDRPEIKQYESQIKADKRNIEVNRAGNRPSIYASWDYYGRSHAVTTTVNTRDWNDYNVLGVTFSWPIFDGWQTKAKVEQAIVDLKKTQIGKTKTIQDIALNVKNTYLFLKNSVDQIKASQADILFYKENLITAEEKFTQGLISSLDKQDAKLKYAVSLFNQRQALYDYVIAKFNFDKATGGFYVY